jgi:hypothetical protein
MFQINNHTPFQAELHPAIDLHGRDFLIVIIKGSYLLSPASNKLNLAMEQVEVQHNDEYYQEAGKSSIKFPSDLALGKPATDVILNGHAYAPGLKPVSQCDVTLSVGDSHHTLRIFGDRVWQQRANSWSISSPEDFERMPLQYEYAYGGFDQSADKEAEKIDCDNFNPCGKGFYPLKGQPFDGLALPNIEDPLTLISNIHDRPKPSGFGAIARDWHPRLAQAGTYDSEWQENRMPLLPTDFDLGFFNAAHPELRFAPHLLGNESVNIFNACESGHQSFNLPGERLFVVAHIRGQDKTLVTELDTVIIQPDERLVTMTWRCAISCSGKLLYVDYVDIKRGNNNGG